MTKLAAVIVALGSIFGLQVQAANCTLSLTGAKMLVCSDNTVFYLKGKNAIYDNQELTPVQNPSDSQKTFSNGKLTVTMDFRILIGSKGRIIVQTPTEHSVHEDCGQWGTVVK